MKIYLEGTSDVFSGIGQVVAAQRKYLPYEFIDSPKEANLITAHIESDLPELDVLHIHGLYWTGDAVFSYKKFHDAINTKIFTSVRKAKVVTVPSRWVGEVFRRELHIDPVVIPHGIETENFQIGNPKDYVLWGKAVIGGVCDPQPIEFLARNGVPCVTTHGRQLKNLKVIGKVDYQEMQKYLSEAKVYLATTPETFGIQTLEAMAYGVPVVGYDWGGTAEIVRNGTDGILVRPLDEKALLEAYRSLMQNWDFYSENARERALEYDWKNIISGYTTLYESLYSAPKSQAGLSIIITNYNYGNYIEECVASAIGQADEVIVVDDGSTDDSIQKIESFGDKVKIIKQENRGVAAARNLGIAISSYDLVSLLDADDILLPGTLRKLETAIRKNSALGIAYGKLMIKSGEEQSIGTWPDKFSWDVQASIGVPPSNCIPTTNVFRKSMWLRAGGFRQRYAPGEDAEFWTRGLSIGFEAKQVTDKPVYVYRDHSDSASKVKEYAALDLSWIETKDFPVGSPASLVKVHSYLLPKVTVIIDDSEASLEELDLTLQSLQNQTMKDWNAKATKIFGDWRDYQLQCLKEADIVVEVMAGCYLPANALEEYALPGRYIMPCSSCGDSRRTVVKAAIGNKVILECIGGVGSSVGVNGRSYPCLSIGYRVLAESADAPGMIQTGFWKLIKQR